MSDTYDWDVIHADDVTSFVGTDEQNGFVQGNIANVPRDTLETLANLGDPASLAATGMSPPSSPLAPPNTPDQPSWWDKMWNYNLWPWETATPSPAGSADPFNFVPGLFTAQDLNDPSQGGLGLAGISVPMLILMLLLMNSR